MFRRSLFSITCLLILAGSFAGSRRAEAHLRPSSDVLLPYFEVGLQSSLTTLFAVTNALDEAVPVKIAVHTNWGIEVARVELILNPYQVKTFNLRDWITAGNLPDRTLTAGELAHLQAALSGRRSPKDDLFYGSEVALELAVGYVTVRVDGAPRPDALWGDFFVVDPEQNFAGGENLVDVDRTASCEGLCSRHALRFLAGAAFNGGTQVVVWTGRVGVPSSNPHLPASTHVATQVGVFDQEGHHVEDRNLDLLPVESMSIAELSLSKPFGWLDVLTDEDSYIGVRYSASNRYAVALQSYCLPVVVHTGPRIRIKKLTNGDDANQAPGPSIPVGDAVLWEYVVTNSGDVPLSGVTVTDDQGVAVSCPEDALQPGETMVCTAGGTATACQYRNVGTATGTPPLGPEVSSEDESHYFGVQDATLTIETAVNGDAADAAPGLGILSGMALHWTYTVRNSGAVVLTGIEVTDDQGLAVACPKTSLAPGESMTCTAESSALVGQHRHLGAATGTPSCGPAVSAEDPGHYHGQPPDEVPLAAVAIIKSTNGHDANTAPGPTIAVGGAVTWTYRVTNTGEVLLNQIVVTDDKGVAVTCPKSTLQPNESMTCTGNGTATEGQYRNVGTVVGQPPNGPPVNHSDPSHYLGEPPPPPPPPAGIGIVKKTNGHDANTAPGPEITVGAPVTWTYRVTNSGQVTLANVQVTDDQGVAVSCPKTTLQPGESMTCTGNGTATAGQYRNVGTVTGNPPSGPPVSDDDPSHYFGEIPPPPPPPPGTEGCTPGYWKNHEDSWPATGFSTGQKVQSVFSQASGFPSLGNATLHQALSFQGGSSLEGAAGNLLRASVAAFLNSAHGNVDYPRSTSAVISDVNAALASQDRDTILSLASALDHDNNLGCPLN